MPAKSGDQVKTVAIGSDHAGFDMKNMLAAAMREGLLGQQYEVKDCGTYNAIDLSTMPPKNVVDYPDYSVLVGRAVSEGDADLGVCVCGSGIGIGMAANKVNGVRAATVNGEGAPQMAGATRKHNDACNDANVICFGKSYITPELAQEALKNFLSTKFEGNYHTGRVEKLVRLDVAYGRVSTAGDCRHGPSASGSAGGPPQPSPPGSARTESAHCVLL